MGLLEAAADKALWECYYNYKSEIFLTHAEDRRLRSYIDSEEYLPVLERIRLGKPFPCPRRVSISKHSSTKKRIVYIYPEPENTVCKLMTWYLIRQYDSVLTPNLYSFRTGHGAKSAIHYLKTRKGIWDMYGYKTDISNYFNSVPMEQFLPILQEIMADDSDGFAFLKTLLTDSYVYQDNTLIVDAQKGLMAGTPQSAFYANIYLADMDHRFFHSPYLYARYSDDILVFAKDMAGLETARADIRETLAKKGLQINPQKEELFLPHEAFSFLGFSCQDGTIDISPVSAEKLKARMRRKVHALGRWQRKNHVSGEKTALAFVRAMNRKLFEKTPEHDLTWSRWFCPVINTTKTLEALDHYMEDNIRFLMTGTRSKKRYNCRYEDLKKLGFRSLVNEYYREWGEEV